MSNSERQQPAAKRMVASAPPLARNPFVFIVGCPRSGTTLLRRMVNAHPAVAIPKRESHWIPKVALRRIGLAADGAVTEELISWLALDERFQYMNITRAELQAVLRDERPLAYPSFVSRIFDIYAAKADKPFAGDKTPGYARHLDLLHELWPNARFIQLIRDGRDVYLSLRDWPKSPRVVGRSYPWAKDPAASAAMFWEHHVRPAREAGAVLGPDLYHEVRYETLVSSPAAACEQICGFLELPFSERMLLTGERRRKLRPGTDAKHARLPPTAGLRNWRTQMPAHDLERFEATAAELLNELGYPPAHLGVLSPAGEESAAVRDLNGHGTD